MFSPIIAGPICEGITCLPLTIAFLLYDLPYILAGVFLFAAAIAWWKQRWSRLAIILLVLALLSAASLIPRYWSVYQAKIRVEREEKERNERNAQLIATADFQLFQPEKAVGTLHLTSFLPDTIIIQDESGATVERRTFRATYETSFGKDLVVDYSSSLASPEKLGWGCSAVGVPLQKLRVADKCTKVGALSDGTAVFRQDSSQSKGRSAYSAIHHNVIFVVALTDIKAADVVSALDGFRPVDRMAMELIRP